MRLGGPRSPWNGNYLLPSRHYLHDPFRFPPGYKAFGRQMAGGNSTAGSGFLTYIRGAAAGAAYGGASKTTNSCECR